MADEIGSFSDMLRTALGDRLAPDAADFVAMMAPDGVMEFPFAPPGLPTRLEGRDAIAAHLGSLGRLISFDRIGAPTVHEMRDENVVVLEFDGYGRGIETGAPYDQRYVSVIHTADGRIVLYRDYWNPLAVLTAINGEAPRMLSWSGPTTMDEPILVLGGRGKTGRLIVDLLHERGIPVRVATREPSGPDDVRFDWSEPATFAPALDGVAAAYLVAPTDRTDHLAVMRPFLEEAVRRGVEPLVLLSAASLAEGGPMMGEVQAWLRDHAPRWISLRPSWFMQNFATQHLADIRDEGRVFSATGDGRVAFIDAADIAAVAVAALTDPAFPTGEVILTGPEAMNYDQVAAAVSTTVGKPVAHARLTCSELADRYEQRGLPVDYAKLLADMDEEIAGGSEDRVTDAVARVLGRPATSFAEFLDRERGTFAPSNAASRPDGLPHAARWSVIGAEYGTVHQHEHGVTIDAGPATDWFHKPGENPRGDVPLIRRDVARQVVSLSAKVKVDFAATYDAGALFVAVDERHWAKLAFERSPQGRPTIVSVVTRDTSDDADGPVHAEGHVWLRIYTDGKVVAFHWSGDGSSWRFARVFDLPGLAARPITIGLAAQSPTGDGVSATFSDIRVGHDEIADLRGGE